MCSGEPSVWVYALKIAQIFSVFHRELAYLQEIFQSPEGFQDLNSASQSFPTKCTHGWALCD